MNDLYILNEDITNGFSIVTLDVIAVTAIVCGVFVIVSKNPIVSVLFLIGLFLSISVYLMTLGINFIGLSYLLVYVGAVSILFLFILMLINVRISEIVSTTSNSVPLGIIIGTLFFSAIHKALPKSEISYIDTNVALKNNASELSEVLLKKDFLELKVLYLSIKDETTKYMFNFYDLIKSVIPTSHSNTSNNMSNFVELTKNSINNLSLTYSHTWDNMLSEVSHINTLGNILYTSYPLWLLLTSLILLLAMVGAIIITIKT